MKNIFVASLVLFVGLFNVETVQSDTVYRCGELYTTLPCRNGKILNNKVSKYSHPEYPIVPQSLDSKRGQANIDKLTRENSTGSLAVSKGRGFPALEPEGKLDFAISGGTLTNEQLRRILGMPSANAEDKAKE